MQKHSDDYTKIKAEGGPFDTLIRLPKPRMT